MAGGLAFRRGRIRSAWGQAIRLPGTGWGGGKGKLVGDDVGRLRDCECRRSGGWRERTGGGGARLRKKGDEGRRMGGRR